MVTEEVLKTCEDIVRLKEGKFSYRTGKATPSKRRSMWKTRSVVSARLAILQPNAMSECYTRTDDDVLNKLRARAANAKMHFS